MKKVNCMFTLNIKDEVRVFIVIMVKLFRNILYKGGYTTFSALALLSVLVAA